MSRRLCHDVPGVVIHGLAPAWGGEHRFALASFVLRTDNWRGYRACSWEVLIARALHVVPKLGVAVDEVVVCVKVELLPWWAIHHCMTIQRDMINVGVSGHNRSMFYLGVIAPRHTSNQEIVPT